MNISKVETAEDILPANPKPVARRMLRARPALAQMATSELKTAAPYVNHGRWVVDCPFGCGGADLAFEDELFHCGTCHNEAVGGKVIRAPFPKERGQIESLLVPRGFVHRNWFPKEPLTNLLIENELHSKELLPIIAEAVAKLPSIEIMGETND